MDFPKQPDDDLTDNNGGLIACLKPPLPFPPRNYPIDLVKGDKDDIHEYDGCILEASSADIDTTEFCCQSQETSCMNPQCDWTTKEYPLEPPNRGINDGQVPHGARKRHVRAVSKDFSPNKRNFIADDFSPTNRFLQSWDRLSDPELDYATQNIGPPIHPSNRDEELGYNISSRDWNTVVHLLYNDSPNSNVKDQISKEPKDALETDDPNFPNTNMEDQISKKPKDALETDDPFDYDMYTKAIRSVPEIYPCTLTSHVVTKEEILPSDILSGRGSTTNNHPGNKRFRQVVDALKFKWDGKDMKTFIVNATVTQLRDVEKIRFLKPLDGTTYRVMNDNECRTKTGQLFREKPKPMVSKRLTRNG